RRAVDQHRAGAALRHGAAVFGAVELEIVAQHVQQRRVRLGIDRADRSVDLQADGHCGCPPRWQRALRLSTRMTLFCAGGGDRAEANLLWLWLELNIEASRRLHAVF